MKLVKFVQINMQRNGFHESILIFETIQKLKDLKKEY